MRCSSSSTATSICRGARTSPASWSTCVPRSGRPPRRPSRSRRRSGTGTRPTSPGTRTRAPARSCGTSAPAARTPPDLARPGPARTSSRPRSVPCRGGPGPFPVVSKGDEDMTPPQSTDTAPAAKDRPSGGTGRKKPATTTKKRNASSQPKGPVDWGAGHGTVSGPLAMAANAAGAAAFGTALGVPATWPLVVAAAGAVGHGLIAPWRRGATGATYGARLAGWAIAGAWSAGVIASDPRHWTGSGFGWAVGTLAAGTLVAHGLASEAELQEEARDEDARSAAKREANAARWAIANEWVDRVEQVAHVRVTPVALAQRPDGTGFALEVALPTEITASRLATFNVALAEAARLPVGCMVQIVPTITQGHVLIDVDTVNTADRVQPYGDDVSQPSVLTGIPWCLDRNSKPVNVFLREACALIPGPMGSGKTTLLDTILAGFCRCPDVLTWVIDLGKKGDAARSFVTPWLESQGVIPPPPNTDRLPEGIRPGVDWVAADPDTALTMLRVAKAIAAWRLIAYAELMPRADTKLLPASARIPFIEIIVDEGGEL